MRRSAHQVVQISSCRKEWRTRTRNNAPLKQSLRALKCLGADIYGVVKHLQSRHVEVVIRRVPAAAHLTQYGSGLG